jgi:hypothetical protein
MRLMKSSFGHQYMVMGGSGTALYPRDESMRYQGYPSGSRLTHAEMAQKVRLERCFRGRSQPGAKSGGRAPIKGPSPVRERAAPDYGPVGSRRPPPLGGIVPPPPRRMVPPPIRMPFNPPSAPPLRSQGGRGRGGRGRGGVVGPQQPQGPPLLDPMGMPGLLQPPGPIDPGETGDATGVQLQHRHWTRGVVGHGHVRTKDLPAGWIRKRDWNLSGGGTAGHEAMGEAASNSLHGNAVIPILHVRAGRPDKENQVREVPATLRNLTGCMLEGVKEWQVGSR